MTTMLQPIAELIGWSLLHLVWEGVAVAAALSVALVLMRRYSPNARYVVSCIALLLFVALPFCNAVWQRSVPDNFTMAQISQLPAAQTPLLQAPNVEIAHESAAEVLPSAQGAPHVSLLNDTPSIPTNTSNAEPLEQSFATGVYSFLDRHMTSLVICWAVGAGLLALRLLGGWILLRRTYSRSRLLAGAELEEAFVRLAGCMQIRQRVRVFLSPLESAPVTFGMFKPIILFPASLLTGLPQAELEALLAHELAHIRRHDYLVNLLQSGAETFLYYHPAVWWISSRIRAERELCCDEMAASACSGGALCLANALARLEEMRPTNARLVLAASGSPLLRRVRRLALGQSGKADYGLAVAPIIVCLTALLFITVFAVRASAQMQPLDGSPTSATAHDASMAPGTTANTDVGTSTPPVADRAPGFPGAAEGGTDPMLATSAAPGMVPAPPLAMPQVPGFIDKSPALKTVGPSGMVYQPLSPPGSPGMPSPQPEVFDLTHREKGEGKTSANAVQIVQQIQKLLYPTTDIKPNDLPDRRFWYDEEAGLLTVVDSPTQLHRVANFLEQPWIKASLQQDDGDTTAAQRILKPTETMRFGDIALRLETIRIGNGVELLIRKGQEAQLHTMAEPSTIQLQDCTVSLMEITGANKSENYSAARIEIRVPAANRSPSQAGIAPISLTKTLRVEGELTFRDLKVRITKFNENDPANQNDDSVEMVVRMENYNEDRTITEFHTDFIGDFEINVMDIQPSRHEADSTVRLEIVYNPQPSTKVVSEERTKQSLPLSPGAALPSMPRSGKFRVRVANNLDALSADKLVSELKKEGYTPAVRLTRPDGRNEVLCGIARSTGEAEALVRDLKSAGFTPEGIISADFDPQELPDIPSATPLPSAVGKSN